MYEKSRELAQLSIQNWASKEVFSFGWYLMVGVLVVAYAVWLKLADRRRGTELLLIGSLEAIAKLLISGVLLSNILGLYDYKIRLVPVPANVFATSITLSPILIMLVTNIRRHGKVFCYGGNRQCVPVFCYLPDIMPSGLPKCITGTFYHFLVLCATPFARLVFLWIAEHKG